MVQPNPQMAVQSGRPSVHTWLVALGSALVPVLFASVGYASAQAAHLREEHTPLIAGAAMLISGFLGLLVLRRFGAGTAVAGFRPPLGGRSLLGFTPLLGAVLIVLLSGGVSASSAMLPGFLVVAAGAALSEEVWFRGIVLSVLRPRGTAYAVIGQAALFGAFHLVNLATGKSALYAGLQLGFAVLFGIVAAQLAILSKSLWPALIWHAAHDVVSYLGGDDLTTVDLVGLAVVVAVLATYAGYLWHRLPR